MYREGCNDALCGAKRDEDYKLFYDIFNKFYCFLIYIKW